MSLRELERKSAIKPRPPSQDHDVSMQFELRKGPLSAVLYGMIAPRGKRTTSCRVVAPCLPTYPFSSYSYPLTLSSPFILQRSAAKRDETVGGPSV